MLTSLHAALVLAAGWSAFPAQQAAAQPQFEAGVEAFIRSDYASAAQAWEVLAQAGHAQAAFNLGRMHEFGQGFARDDALAARWYRMAAERGHPGAQHALGLILAEGRAGPADPLEAHLWLSLAARQAAAGSAAARVLALQLAGIGRQLTAGQLADAEAALAAWAPRRD